MQDSDGVRDYLFYPTLVGHIHLDKHLINNFLSLRLLYIYMKAYYSFDLFNSDCVHIYAIYFIKIHNTERVNT
jgi:hypothetical protein